MNTYKKGDSLEKSLLRYLRNELKTGRLPFTKSNCKIYHKKGYFSKDRQSEIVFDVAIEIYIAGQSKYSMLWLFECKNYGSTVQVNEIEEFHSKTSQITDSNTKAVLVSKSPFASGTLNIAKSKGIGLLRFHSDSSVKWELARTVRDASNVSDMTRKATTELFESLTIAEPRSLFSRISHYSGSILSNQLYDLFISQFSSDTNKQFMREFIKRINTNKIKDVAYISKAEIETKANEVLGRILYSGGKVNLDMLCKYEKKKNKLKVTIETGRFPFEEREGVLGRISFDPLEIVIFACSTKEHARQRFTLAHELGHYFLGHSRYIEKEYYDVKDFTPYDDGDSSGFDTERSHSRSVIEKLEWQANVFAAALLMPKRDFINRFNQLMTKYGIQNKSHGKLYVDSQRCNRDNFTHFLSELTMSYDVSKTAVSIRAESLGMLVYEKQY